MDTHLNTPANTEPQTFSTLLATYREAQAAQERFYAANVTPHVQAMNAAPRGSEAYEAARKLIHQGEAGYGEYTSRTYEAAEALLRSQARTPHELLEKLTILIAEDAFERPHAIALLGDVAHLAWRA